MKVVRLATYRGRDTIRVLTWLLKRAVDGEVAGMAICFKDSEGHEHSAFTGDYRSNPSEGIAAGMRLSWKLTQEADLRRGPP